MSQENLEIIQTLFEAFKQRDVETMGSLMDPEVEWDATRFGGVVPDVAGVYHGAEGTQRLWRTWLSSWKDLQFEYELRHTDDQVVALIRNQRQWGRHSGIETEIQPYACVYTVRDGKVFRVCFYADHESALEAAGLSE
jgi:ketosteroid isomerase-like protein